MRFEMLPALILACAACGSRGGGDPADSTAEDAHESDVDAPHEPDTDVPDDAEDADAPDVADSGTDWTWYDGPVPEVPAFTKDDHLASCVRSRACSTSNPQQLGTCMASYASIDGRPIGITLGWVARCVAGAAADCDEIVDCLTDGEGPTECEPLVTPDRCDGTVLRQCSRISGIDLVVDCAELDMECHIDATGTASCGLGTCDPTTFRPDCHGDTLVVCEEGVVVMALCDAAGLACVQEPGEPGRCAGGGASCTDASDPRRCEEHRIVGCIEGSLADVDCDAVVPLWTCGDRGGVAGCVPPGDECTAEPLFGTDVDESCDGDLVHFCMDGWLSSVACSDYGMGPCTDLGTAARCTPP